MRRGILAKPIALLLVLMGASCAPSSRPSSGSGPEPTRATAAAVGEPVTLEGDGYVLPATLELPEAAAPVPCVVFFAGSGPTDRDWLSPLIPGKNGSGRQLAQALRTAGIGSLRFDKVGTVRNPKPLSILSLEHYADEGELAYRYLKGRPECGRLFLLGNSEGALHALRVAVRLQHDPDFGGLISTAGPSVRMLDLVVEQLREQKRQQGADLGAVERALEAFRDAAERLPDGADKPPDLSAIPEARILWRTMTDATQGKVVRELMLADPLAAARNYHGPALILSAEHDAQVPPEHGARLFGALPGAGHPEEGHPKAHLTIQDANHVFKHETRAPGSAPPLELVKAYAEEGRELATGVVPVIAAFIKDVSAGSKAP